MRNQYSPFQYVPERGGANFFSLNIGLGKKIRETKLLDIVRRCETKIHHSSMFQKGAGLNFSFYNIGLGKNFRETKLLDIVRRCETKILHSSMFQKGAGLNFSF